MFFKDIRWLVIGPSINKLIAGLSPKFLIVKKTVFLWSQSHRQVRIHFGSVNITLNDLLHMDVENYFTCFFLLYSF